MKNPLQISIGLFIFLFCLAFAKTQNRVPAKIATRNVSSETVTANTNHHNNTAAARVTQ